MLVGLLTRQAIFVNNNQVSQPLLLVEWKWWRLLFDLHTERTKSLFWTLPRKLDDETVMPDAHLEMLILSRLYFCHLQYAFLFLPHLSILCRTFPVVLFSYIFSFFLLCKKKALITSPHYIIGFPNTCMQRVSRRMISLACFFCWCV